MQKFLRVFHFFNILSLDIAAGAMASTLFFGRLFDVDVLPQGLISLGLTVWIIYTTDHLLDAKKIGQTAATERHRFHQLHFKPLFVLMMAAILVDITQIYFIRVAVFRAGSELATIVAVYFLVQRRLGFLKELLGTLLYTGGVLLIPLAAAPDFPPRLILLVAQFALTAWINLLLYSWIDCTRDKTDHHNSFATIFGERASQRLLIALFASQGMLALVGLLVASAPLKAVVVLLCMNSVMLLIFVKRDFFEVNDRYRILGDGVFLLPLVYTLI